MVSSLPAVQPKDRTDLIRSQNRIDQLTQLIEEEVPPAAKWIYTAETSHWPAYLSEVDQPWSSKNPAHPTIELLLRSSTIPLWAADKETSQELRKAMAAFKTLEFAEKDIKRFIDSTPQQEDDIKQYLKITASGNNKTVEKLQQAQSTLFLVSTDSTRLPTILISTLRRRVQTSEPLIQKYYDNIAKVSEKRKTMGIVLNQTNQTPSQTAELLKNFSGQGCLSFPQWKHESFETLQSSGISKAHWYSIILKKVVAPASAKISQESVSSKDIDRILADLDRHYNSSRIISETIFNIHLAAGKIPDPEFNSRSFYV